MRNEKLVKAALDRQKRILELEVEMNSAKENYSDAVRKLHESDMSYREIAVRLGVSHQRIHQIVEEKRKKEQPWIKLVKHDLHCVFCGLSNNQVDKLVAGSKTFICDSCAENCSKVAETNNTMSNKHVTFKPLKASTRSTCSFCARAGKGRTPIVGSQKHQLCDVCLQSILKCLKND